MRAASIRPEGGEEGFLEGGEEGFLLVSLSANSNPSERRPVLLARQQPVGQVSVCGPVAPGQGARSSAG